MSKIIVIVLSVLLLITFAGIIYFHVFYGPEKETSPKKESATSIATVKKNKTVLPRAVYNKCTGKWAVQIAGFYDWYFGGQKNDDTSRSLDYFLYFGKGEKANTNLVNGNVTIGFRDSTAIDIGYGEEYTFSDSSTAIKTYLSFVNRIHIRDSLAKRAQFVKDSIFKCQHTYQ